MFRSRLLGVSFVVSVLINLLVLGAIGAFAPDSRLLPSTQSLKAVHLRVYHPPLAKRPPAKPAHLAKKLPAPPRRIHLARATPAPPFAHPRRRMAATHPASGGRRAARLAVASDTGTLKPMPPIAKPHAAPAHVAQIQPAPPAPRVVATPAPAPVVAPAPSSSHGNSAGSPAAAEAGAGAGSGNSEGAGSGPAAGAGSAGGPFGIGSGGGGGPRHIVYVLDVSPSMKTRIDRARQELRNALLTLQPGESFDIIAFGGDTKPLADDLLPASPQNIQQADQFLGSLDFIPGTDLQDVLYSALAISNVNVIVLITDGVPTVGETDFGKIARHIRKHNLPHARIYTIGLVGKNPDGTDQSFEAAQLLQQLAHDSGGDSRLIPLGETTPDD